MSAESGIRGAATVRKWVLAVLVAAVAAAIWLAQAAHHRADPEDTYQAALDDFFAGSIPQLEARTAELRAQEGPSLRVQLLEGMRDLRIGRWADAARNLKAASADREMRPVALGLLGEAHYRQGRLLQAERVLQAALSLDPRQTTARRWLAAAYYDLGANDLALEQLSLISEQDAADPRPFRLRALIYKDFERFQEAIDQYGEALNRHPEQSVRRQIVPELAACQIKLRRYEDALQSLADAPETAETLALRATCDYALDRQEPARQAIAAALALDGRHFESLSLSGRMALDAGDLPASARYFEAAINVRPAEYEVRYQLAGVYRRLGRAAEADAQIDEMERLQKLRKEFTELHYQAFRDTQDAELRYRLGELARQLDKPDLAATWFEAALALDPAHPKAAGALEELKSAGAGGSSG
jgi:tetratricopeptide (TPR) repeat protein